MTLNFDFVVIYSIQTSSCFGEILERVQILELFSCLLILNLAQIVDEMLLVVRWISKKT